MEYMLIGGVCVAFGTALGYALRPNGLVEAYENKIALLNRMMGKLSNRIGSQRRVIRALRAANPASKRTREQWEAMKSAAKTSPNVTH